MSSSSESSSIPPYENLTIRDVVIKGFVPHSSFHEGIKETDNSCKFCNNTAYANRVYLISAFFDRGTTKKDLQMCSSCMNDFMMYVGATKKESRLIVVDRYESAKSEVFSVIRDIVSAKDNNSDNTDNDNIKSELFLNTIKSLYEKSNAVKYYIGDSSNINLDNKKLWPLMYDFLHPNND